MPAHFNPEFDPADVNSDYGQTGGDITVPTFTADYSPFKFWCQKTLPLVFDDSLSYYEVLCKLVTYVNNLLTDLQTATGSIGTFAQQFVVNQQFLNQMAEQLGTNTAQLESYINDRMEDFSEAYSSLQEYVNTYFANLDVQEEINTKLDQMAQDGTLDSLLQPFTEDWLDNMTAEITADLAQQNQTLATQNSRISVLEGRMDTFSTLPAGSTSGNAELLDIRTNFLGETYSSAGDAVRASDMITSGYASLANSGEVSDQYLDGNVDPAFNEDCNTLSFNISHYKGGRLAYIFNVAFGLFSHLELATDLWGKGSSATPDSNMTKLPLSYDWPYNGHMALLKQYPDGGERILVTFDIPENEAATYYYFPYTDYMPGIAAATYPNYLFYASNWSKTPVDDTLTQAGQAADAKATGDAIEQLDAEIADVTTEISYKFGFKNETDASLFDSDDVYASVSLARTRRWFVNRAFNAGDIINAIGYAVSQDSTSSATVYTEIWEENNGSLTKVYSDSKVVTAAAAQSGTVITYNVLPNYTVQKKAYVCFCFTGSRNPVPYTTDASETDNVLVSTDVDPATETLAFSSLSTFATKLIPSITIDYTAYLGVNVVTIGDGMDYNEIQDAILAINDDTPNNPYTFLLMPKKTPYKPFSMLRDSFSNNYPWSGIRTRNISIIGMDKAHCIIKSDSGDYKFPCGEPLTNGIIKNITFIMTNDDQTPTATQGGYCLHIDCKPLNDMGYKMQIEDCDFVNSSGPCVGIGVHANCDLQFRRCHFETTLSAEYNPHEGYRNLADYGVVYAHTSTAEIAPNQKLTFIDCEGVCAEGTKSLRIDRTTQYDPLTSSFVYTLLRNVFWNTSLNNAGYGIGSTLTPNPMNFGNNN